MLGNQRSLMLLQLLKTQYNATFHFVLIDPNIGIVDVPDERLEKLSVLSKSKKKILANITFVDIAGLVKGASKGEGLGNKFLSHIREVDAVVHLVRCFKNDKIQHVNNLIDPINDLEIIKTEIVLSDIDLIQKKLEKSKKKILSPKEFDLLQSALKNLNEGEEITVQSDEDYKFF